MSATKQRLLDKWLSGVDGGETIPRRVTAEPVPLSFAQERMWFLAQLNPDSGYLNMVETLRLTGALDEDALRRALEQLVRRHASLRTVFTADDGDPVQVVLADVPLPLVVTDFDGERAAIEWLQAECQRPFDLAREPSVRFHLVRTGPGDRLLMTTLHHIAGDGLSLAILCRELFALYAAFESGEPDPLPPLPIQYPDFSEWQRGRLTGQLLRDQVDYWRAALGEPVPVIDQLADHVRHGEPSLRVVNAPVRLSAELSAAVRASAREHEATLFMTVLAGFTALLHRCTGRTDLVLGSVVHGRDRPETEHVIGMFANTLALRADLPAAAFTDVLRVVRQTCLGAFSHRETPIDLLVAELKPGRNHGQNPLFQVACVWEAAAEEADRMGAVRVAPVDFELDASEFDLVLHCWEEGGRINGVLRGSTDLFRQETVDRLAGALPDLLAEAVADPRRPVLDLLPGLEIGARTAPRRTERTAATTPTAGAEPGTETEWAVAEVFAEVLGRPSVAADDDFFELGGHSLRAMRVLLRLRKRLGVDLAPQTFFDAPTVGALAAAIDRARDGAAGGADDIDLRAEAVLDPEITPPGPAGRTELREVLLTGAESFYGVHVLAELLARTDAVVHCLVEAEEPEQAEELLSAAVAENRLEPRVAPERLRVVAGSLREPLLGLSRIGFDRLAGKLDAIYHLGCESNLTYSYRQLKAANVDATREVLRLATRGRNKPVHYMSSPSALIHRDGISAALPEDGRLDPAEVLSTGYPRTRWVAEEMVRAASGRGVPAAIYRPGRITGSAGTGAGQIDMAFWKFIRSCLELGAIPYRSGDPGTDVDLDMVPMDYVAAALVHISLRPIDDLRTYHLANPRRIRLRTVIDHLRAAGYRLRAVDGAEWSELVQSAADDGRPDDVVSSFAALQSRAADLPRFGSLRLDTTNTLAALAGSAIRCPEVDDGVLAGYLAFFLDNGLLKPPPEDA
ncbi:thioester reductase domain-containing protein [Saccharopolyspora shandongensis]|uniref:thioester reductase domain-containing protein n=1 Tax=Saccharopolyspora shandongensis TaxID=418495 RepID=UPI0033CE2418